MVAFPVIFGTEESFKAPLPVSLAPVWEVDAGRGDSWDGVSGLLKNRIAAPAYGGAQADYDFVLGSIDGADTSDPTFTGIVGDAAAYFALDGADYFKNKASSAAAQPDFLKKLQRSDTAIQHTFIFAGNMPSTGAASVSQAMCGNSNFSASDNGFGWFSGIYFGGQRDKLTIARRDGTTADYVSLNTAITADGTDKLIIGTYHAGTGAWQFWVNGAKSSGTLAAFTSTADATDYFTLCAFGEVFKLLAGSRFYAAAMLNKIVNDTEAAQILDIFRKRHKRAYA